MKTRNRDAGRSVRGPAATKVGEAPSKEETAGMTPETTSDAVAAPRHAGARECSSPISGRPVIPEKPRPVASRGPQQSRQPDTRADGVKQSDVASCRSLMPNEGTGDLLHRYPPERVVDILRSARIDPRSSDLSDVL